jgi:hypothetical protein
MSLVGDAGCRHIARVYRTRGGPAERVGLPVAGVGREGLGRGGRRGAVAAAGEQGIGADGTRLLCHALRSARSPAGGVGLPVARVGREGLGRGPGAERSPRQVVWGCGSQRRATAGHRLPSPPRLAEMDRRRQLDRHPCRSLRAPPAGNWWRRLQETAHEEIHGRVSGRE